MPTVNTPTVKTLTPRHAIVAIAIALWVCACSSGPAVKAPGGKATARGRYFEGMKEFKAHNYIRAGALFGLLARGPSYIRYTALAQLRLADLQYFQGGYQQAALKYGAFAAQHPTNPNVPYARFMVAKSYAQRMPSRFFLLPPAHEGELSTTRQAVKALTGFIRKFPVSRFTPEAEKLLSVAKKLLCEHELYVAKFYRKRGKSLAVAWRLEGAIKRYPKCARTPKNVWRMAVSYAKAGFRAQAARGFGLYLESFPKGSRRQEAFKQMEAIRKASQKTKRPAKPKKKPASRPSSRASDAGGKKKPPKPGKKKKPPPKPKKK